MRLGVEGGGSGGVDVSECADLSAAEHDDVKA